MLNCTLFVSDIFNLEDQLPEELLGGPDPQGAIANGPCPPTAVNVSKSIVQSQLQSFTNSVGGAASMPAPSQLMNPNPSRPPSQPHKQLTQLLQSDRNSPKYPSNMPSPGNAGIGSPHPSRQPTQPQPSPASNSMQSPNAGSLIGNIKSPVNASTGNPVPVSRTPGNMRTTPSPRVLSSLAMSSSVNSPLVHTSMQNAGGFTRNLPSVPQNQTISNPNMVGVTSQQHVGSNGPVQPQMQVLQQNMGGMRGVPSNMNNISGMQRNFTGTLNSSSVVVSKILRSQKF